MRSLAEQAQAVAELREIRNALNASLTNTRSLISRVDRLMGYYDGIPRTTLTVAPDPEPEPEAEVAPEPEPVEDFEEFEEPTREQRPYSVSRLFGKMFYEQIETKARAEGEFTGVEFAQLTGLSGGDPMTWLNQLVSRGVVTFAAGKFTTVQPPSLHLWVVNHDDMEFDVEKASEVTRQAVEDAQEEIDDLLAKKIITTVNGSGVYQYVKPGTHLSPNHHPHRAPPEKDPPCYSDAPSRGEPVRIRKDTRRSRSTSGAGGIKGPKQRNARYEQMQTAKAARSAEQSAKDKARYGGSGNKDSSRKARKKASQPV